MFSVMDDQVKTNLIQAFGVDTRSINAMVYQEQFIKMKCFMEYQTLNKEELIKVWVKILDP
jgi:aryl carrier-like protein